MEFYQNIITWYMDNINYTTITALMTVESSFIPFPSEIIIPPAAFKSTTGELNIYLIVLFGTIGALLGAYVNYFLAKYLGRNLIYKFAETRFANFCLIDAEKIKKAEEYFVKNGKTSTFIGRLVPGIRQLISIPAGLANMPLWSFSIYTFVGAAIWNIILAALGVLTGNNKELFESYYHELSIIALGLGTLFVAYLIYNGFKKHKKLKN